MKNPSIIIRSRPIRHLFGFAGLVSIVLLIVSGCKTPFFNFKAKGGEVHGFVVSGVRLDKTNSEWAGRRIYLPDITVYLKSVSTGVLSPKVRTDLDGSFIIPRQVAGKYELIAEANGFLSSATPVVVSIVSSTVYPQPFPIVPKLSVVFGKARLMDQRPGRYINAPLGVDIQTTVRLLDANGATVAGPVRANTSGIYLIPNVPSGASIMRAECQSAQINQPLPAVTAFTLADLTMPNANPKVRTVVASQNGQPVRQANAGTIVSVSVEAFDPDGDALHYRWQPTDAGSPFTSVDATSVQWTLPNAKGLHSMYVYAFDNKGGSSLGRVDIQTDESGVLFTGTITGSDGPLLKDATVSINGEKTASNARGHFILRLAKESPRYVISISKDGYALLSKVTYEPVIGGKYRLVKADQKVVDPTKPIDATETIKSNRNDRVGVRVQIDANSLVDQNGNAPGGSLNLYLHSYDLRDAEGIPGEYWGQDAGGQDVTLTSYGAPYIEVKDTAGKLYNLAPGKTATVTLAVDPAQLTAPGNPAPATIPFWYYEPVKGLWQREQAAALVGNNYVVQVKHFSVMNVDVTKVDAACMRILVDQTQIPILPFDLRITAPNSSGIPTTFTRTVDDPISVIIRLPPLTPVLLEILDAAGNPITLPGYKQTVNSGAAIPGVAGTTPVRPYKGCSSEAILPINPPSDNGFLTFRYGEGDYVESEAIANAYYEAIGTPINGSGPKTSLAGWKAANGFTGTISANEEEAVYLNDGDLGLGRWMHMRKDGAKVAYYVSNYGLPPASGSADVAALAKLNNNPGFGLIATVAMEYSPGPAGGAPYTKFYVFNSADKLVNFADLDGRGPKFVPNLCVMCHGGNPPGNTQIGNNGNVYPNNGNIGSKFIPFDIASYKYADGIDNPASPGTFPFRKDAQESAFKNLNRGILATDPTAAIKALVEGWYGGSSLPAATHISSFVPPAWTGTPQQANLYAKVVNTSCRACHTTRGLDWATFSLFDQFGGTIQDIVCQSRRMPQAKRTFDNFWLSTSPHRPETLKNFGLTGWNASRPCPE